MVKDELNSEEKFFEKAVITEKFVKRYKKPMVGALVAIVLFVSANIVYDANKQNQILEANLMLSKLQQNPSDKSSLESLKLSSPALYDVWMLSQAVSSGDTKSLESLQKSKALFVKDIATYELGNVDTYSSMDGVVLKDLAIVQSAVILMNENKISEAHDKLSLIPVGSSLSKIALGLMHYGVK
jgi:hypothetical protein